MNAPNLIETLIIISNFPNMGYCSELLSLEMIESLSRNLDSAELTKVVEFLLYEDTELTIYDKAVLCILAYPDKHLAVLIDLSFKIKSKLLILNDQTQTDRLSFALSSLINGYMIYDELFSSIGDLETYLKSQGYFWGHELSSREFIESEYYRYF